MSRGPVARRCWLGADGSSNRQIHPNGLVEFRIGWTMAAGYQREGRILRIDEPGAGFLLLRKDNHAELHRSLTSAALDDRLWLADLHEASGLRSPVAL